MHGVASHLSNPVQFEGYTDARQRRIDDGRKALTTEVVDHIQNAELSTARQAVRYKVEAPTLARLWGMAIRFLVLKARFLPPRLRTVGPSSL